MVRGTYPIVGIDFRLSGLDAFQDLLSGVFSRVRRVERPTAFPRCAPPPISRKVSCSISVSVMNG
jgi:hypothetical protein